MKRTRASTCSSSRARSRRRTAASTARSAGRTAIDIARRGRREGRPRSSAIGSCAVVGRRPVRRRRTRPARPASPQILKGKPVVTLPGCPANPYNLLGTVLQFATFGTLPGARRAGPAEVRLRPRDPRGLPAPRRTSTPAASRRCSATRATATAGASTSSAARGRRPTPTARCSHFCEVPGAWPIGIGHPCVGCTEQGIAFRVPIYTNLPIERPTAARWPTRPSTPDHSGRGSARSRSGSAGARRSARSSARACVARRSSPPKGDERDDGKEWPWPSRDETCSRSGRRRRGDRARGRRRGARAADGSRPDVGRHALRRERAASAAGRASRSARRRTGCPRRPDAPDGMYDAPNDLNAHDEERHQARAQERRRSGRT